MRTVQLTLDGPLVEEVDEVAKRLGTSRSAFTRDALRAALTRLRTEELETRHREGYAADPVEPDEVRDWGEEQVWPE